MIRRLLLLSLAMLAVHDVPGGWGQAGPDAVDPPFALDPVAVASAGDAEEARPGFGLSGAVRILVASPGALLQSAPMGDWGWQDGHRWVAVAGRGIPQVLGEPVRSAGFLQGELRAPAEPGVWRLESAAGGSLTVVTSVPASSQTGTHLNGYYMGLYPTAGSDRDDLYAPPTAFLEVLPNNQDLPISDHLRLGQFLTKDQFEVWPKYVALDMRLVDKLELVVRELQGMGVHAESIHVMSGFRSPQYNGPGGDGRAALSRHMWGDAADVWIDNLGTGEMDDLNGDGKVDIDDAAVIMRAVERVEARYPELIGGAGTYPSRPGRGPYIHIDARGHRSRW